MGAKIAGSEATLLMAAVDTDGGGSITADEFLNFSKRAVQLPSGNPNNLG